MTTRAHALPSSLLCLKFGIPLSTCTFKKSQTPRTMEPKKKGWAWTKEGVPHNSVSLLGWGWGSASGTTLAFAQSVLDLHQHALDGPLGTPLGSLQCLSPLGRQNWGWGGRGTQSHIPLAESLSLSLPEPCLESPREAW